jgi:hypothetical protein
MKTWPQFGWWRSWITIGLCCALTGCATMKRHPVVVGLVAGGIAGGIYGRVSRRQLHPLRTGKQRRECALSERDSLIN